MFVILEMSWMLNDATMATSILQEPRWLYWPVPTFEGKKTGGSDFSIRKKLISGYGIFLLYFRKQQTAADIRDLYFNLLFLMPLCFLCSNYSEQSFYVE